MEEIKYTIKPEHFLHRFDATTRKRGFEFCLFWNNNNNNYYLKLEPFHSRTTGLGVSKVIGELVCSTG